MNQLEMKKASALAARMVTFSIASVACSTAENDSKLVSVSGQYSGSRGGGGSTSCSLAGSWQWWWWCGGGATGAGGVRGW